MFSSQTAAPKRTPTPILFTIMINDMFSDSDNLTSYSLYADDVAIWCSDSDLSKCYSNIQSTLDKIHEWSQNWGFKFSAAKSKAIFFTRKRLPNLILTLDSQPIELVPSFKFLGLHFDRNLTWKNHILYTKDRCNSDLNLLKIVAAQKWGADYTIFIVIIRNITIKIAYFFFQSSFSFLVNFCKVSSTIRRNNIQETGLSVSIKGPLKPLVYTSWLCGTKGALIMTNIAKCMATHIELDF